MQHIPNTIQQKLERFLRKFYTLKLLKGAILGVGLLGIYFLVLGGLELSLRMGQLSRMILFYSFLSLGAAVFLIYILWPILQLFRLGRKLSYEAAAKLIGNHFSDVDDKLLNLLQLRISDESQRGLIEASIEQRSKQLNPYDFTQALQLKKAFRFWPFLALPVAVVIFLSLSGKVGELTEATNRVVQYSEDFKPAFPFEITFENELNVERGSNYTMQVSFVGNKKPVEMLMNANGKTLRLVNQGNGTFTHNFSNLKTAQTLQFLYGEVNSVSYELSVQDVPQLNDFVIEIKPPNYTGFPATIESVENVITIPEGSDIRLVASANFVDKLYLKSDSVQLNFVANDNDKSLEVKKLRDKLTYQLFGEYQSRLRQLSPNNTVAIIKDAFPKVQAEWQKDSVNPNRIYYRYEASDDYAVSRALLKVQGAKGVLYEKKVNTISGYGALDLADYVMDKEQVEVFIEVYDNDGVNGSKRAKSEAYKTLALGEKEYKEYLSNALSNASADKAKMNEKLTKQSKEYDKQLKKIKSGEYKFKDKKALEELIEEQKELLKKKEKLEEQRKELEKEAKKERQEDIRDKKKDEELNKLLEEIEKLKDKLGIEDLEKKLEKIKELTDQISQQENRQDKLEKKLESERAILEALDKLNEAQKKQEALANEDNNDAAKQAEVKKQLEEVNKELEKQKEENESFEKAAEKQGLDEKQDKAEEQVEKAAQEDGEQGAAKEGKKSSSKKESQKKASESLKEMAEGLQQAFMEMQSEQEGEDAQMLRQVLENVEELSQGTERVLERTKRIEQNDPAVKTLLLNLNKLSLGTGIIRDSLTALANRNPKIKQKVFEELTNIENNQRKSLDELQNVELSQSSGHQQYIMLAANNLALMLDASLQQMMQQMAQQKPGNQNCQKPGGKKPNKAGMAKMQGELAKQMAQQMAGKKKGKDGKPSDGKEGKEGKDGEQGDNGELAKMISKQEQLREAYKQMQEDGEKEAEGGNGKTPVEKLMEEVEKDMYEDNITNETLERVKEIETRLLEDERAKRKQEMDEQREAQEASEQKQQSAEELRFFKDKGKSREGLLYDELMLNPRLN